MPTFRYSLHCWSLINKFEITEIQITCTVKRLLKLFLFYNCWHPLDCKKQLIFSPFVLTLSKQPVKMTINLTFPLYSSYLSKWKPWKGIFPYISINLMCIHRTALIPKFNTPMKLDFYFLVNIFVHSHCKKGMPYFI